MVATFNTVNAARFVAIGTLPGGTQSRAEDVSADGSLVVGTGFIGGTYSAFRWSEAGGIEFLEAGNNQYYTATAISPDGSVIVGELTTGRPYRWTEEGGVVPIAPRLLSPSGLSFDGSIIVGGRGVHDVSWDGNVVVGVELEEAFRDQNGVRTWLGDLPGYAFDSAAFAVSPDGSVVVGRSASAVVKDGQQFDVDQPFYWTISTGMVPLGSGSIGAARDISQTKLVIVGEGIKILSPSYGAFRWTPARGMESIQELLLMEGIDLSATGWQQLQARLCRRMAASS